MATYNLKRWRRPRPTHLQIWAGSGEWAIEATDYITAVNAAKEVLGEMKPKAEYATLASKNGMVI
jgi:hypothetical protein